MNHLEKASIFVLLFSSLLWSGEILSADAGDDILLPGRTGMEEHVIIRAPIAVADTDRPAVYNLKRWVVEEEADPVQRALETYKKKSESSYTRRILLTGKTDGKKHVIVEFVPPAEGGKVLFTEDEDFMYYLGLGTGGQSNVYGINLLSNKKFSLGSGENFQTVNCPDKKSYVVVQPDGQGTVYQGFSASGERMKDLTNLQDPVDIEKNLCR